MLSGYFLAGILTLCGTGCLYASWAGKSPAPKGVTSLTGWLLLAVSLWPWMHWSGAEFAWILWLFVPACGAWCWVLWHNRSIPAGGVITSHPKVVTRSLWPSWRQVGDSLGRLLLYIPYCGIMSTWFTLALAKKLFAQGLDQGAFVVILTPLLWGALVGWLLMSIRLWRSVGIIGSIGGVSAVLLYFTAW